MKDQVLTAELREALASRAKEKSLLAAIYPGDGSDAAKREELRAALQIKGSGDNVVAGAAESSLPELAELLGKALPSRPNIVEIDSDLGRVVTELYPEDIFTLVDGNHALLIDLLPEMTDAELFGMDELTEEAYSPADVVQLSTEEKQLLGSEAVSTTRTVKRVNAPHLWSKGLSGAGIRIAVVDSGVNFAHPDLKSREVGSINIITNSPSVPDSHGHGTAVAGLVGGDGTSGVVTGCAPGCDLIGVKAGKHPYFLREGVKWAIQQGAQIVVIAWGTNSDAEASCWRKISASALHNGVLLVAAAGDNGLGHAVPDSVLSPADCPPPWLHPDQLQRPNNYMGTAVMAIGESYVQQSGTSFVDKLAGSSPNGPTHWPDFPYDGKQYKGLLKPEACAPGSGTTCYKNHGVKLYDQISGTSGAAPVVAGCAALLAEATVRSKKPLDGTALQRINEALEMSCVPLYGNAGHKFNGYGSGRVDVLSAYNYGTDPSRQWWT